MIIGPASKSLNHETHELHEKVLYKDECPDQCPRLGKLFECHVKVEQCMDIVTFRELLEIVCRPGVAP
jgi:hypothetical protein